MESIKPDKIDKSKEFGLTLLISPSPLAMMVETEIPQKIHLELHPLTFNINHYQTAVESHD